MESDRSARTAYNKARSLAAVRDREVDEAFAALMQHPAGRRAINWLLQISAVGGNPFASNALVTSFNCGALNIGNQLLARITRVAPDLYLTMLKEMEDERRDSSAAGTDAGDD